MAKTKISEYSSTASENTDINNININEGCAPSNINNAIRELMSQIKNLQAGTSGDTVPVAAGGTGGANATTARTNLSAAASGANSDITSLSGITTPLTLIQGGTGGTKASISNVARTSNVATITTSSSHGFTTDNKITIVGVTTAGFNAANVTVASTPSGTTFTYANTGDFVGSTADTTGSAISLTSIGTNFGLGTASTATAPTGTIVGTTDTQTLTNKRITAKSLAAANTSGSVTPDSDAYDQVNYLLTGSTSFANPSGTPTNGQKLHIRLYAASTQTVSSWGDGYRIIGTLLPTSVPAGKTIYVGCIWNSTDSKWDVVAVATQL